LSDEEYTTLANMPFAFDRKEATFTEKQCLDWVKKIVPPKTEPDAPGEVESPGDEEGESPAHEISEGGHGKRLHRRRAH